MTMAADLLKETSVFLYWWSVAKSQSNSVARLKNRISELLKDTEKKVMEELVKKGVRVTDDATRRKIVDILITRYNEAIIVEATKAAEVGRKSAAELSAGIKVELKPFTSPVLERLQQHVFEASKRTVERIAGDVMGNLAGSFDKGLGIEEAAKRLQEVFDRLKGYEAERIARTEINSAQNWGANETVKELCTYKQWWTAEDDRVRGDDPKDASDHIKMHGEVVRVDEPFSNGLHYPGDRSGPIEEWINCRCTEVPYIPRIDEIITSTPYYPKGV